MHLSCLKKIRISSLSFLTLFSTWLWVQYFRSFQGTEMESIKVRGDIMFLVCNFL